MKFNLDDSFEELNTKLQTISIVQIDKQSKSVGKKNVRFEL